MHFKSDKLQCPTYTSTEQCMSYRSSYDVLQTQTKNNAYHIGQATISFRHQHRTIHIISEKLRCPSDTNTEQCMSYRKRYDVLQTPTQNNACYVGQGTLSFIYQHRTVHVISETLRCLSDNSTEQCMSYRTNYDVHQTPTQNNACNIGLDTVSFSHLHRTIHVISDKLRCPSDTNIEQCM